MLHWVMGRMRAKPIKAIVLAKSFLLAAIVLLGDYYFFHPSLRVLAVALALLFVVFILFEKPILLRRTVQSSTNKETKRVVWVAVIFLTYMVVLDVFRHAQQSEYLTNYLTGLLIVACLPIYEDRRTPFETYRHFRLYMMFSLGFAVLQFAGMAQNLGTLLPNLGIVQSDNFINEATVKGMRVAGATSNVIGFAEQVAILAVASYCSFMHRRSPRQVMALFFSLVVLLATQARAAILGIIPSIVVANIMLGRNKVWDLVRVFALAGVVGLVFYLAQDLITSRFTYFSREVTTGDTYRFWVNLYMAEGVLKESPWFGISRDAAWDFYMRYGDLSLYGFTEHATPTHHNQLAFYLRYYGLVGLGLLLSLYAMIFRKILRSPLVWIRIFLASIFVMDFVYSMAHNNKVISSPLLWILLSMASLEPAQGKKPL